MKKTIDNLFFLAVAIVLISCLLWVVHLVFIETSVPILVKIGIGIVSAWVIYMCPIFQDPEFFKKNKQ